MSTPKPWLGFRVVGKATSPRRLTDTGAALAAYAACDPKAEVHKEAYLSAFAYDTAFRDYLATNGSVKGYNGACWAPFLWFDIDRQDNLDTALRDARRLAAGTLQRYPSLNDDDLLAFFSGSKGFHIGLPGTWLAEPSADYHRVARHFSESLAGTVGVAVDAGTYLKVQLFRAPNSRHAKTKLHKRRLSFDELMHLGVDAILEMAREPEPFDLPSAVAANNEAAADWQAAVAAVAAEAEVKAQRRDATANGSATLNHSTLEFIRDGAGNGDRHRLLFSAAANLSELGCPAAAVHALLTEAALDSGLKPSDVRRQIECGVAHVSRLHNA
jgi:hypothetical protein